MKSFHVICAKCGSMDVYFKQHINKDMDDEYWKDENYTSFNCNNCSEHSDVLGHNDYMKESNEMIKALIESTKFHEKMIYHSKQFAIDRRFLENIKLIEKVLNKKWSEINKVRYIA